METTTHEIADRIYRFSTYVPDIGPGGFTFNQFLVDADEPLLFHTGPRAMFPLVSEAVGRVRALTDLRWITFGHVEADECGAMNLFLAACPRAEVAHNATGNLVSLNDLADRAPRTMGPDESYALGADKVVRNVDTPHVPHNWESHVLFEETTATLLCGDLFTHLGNGPAITEEDVVEKAVHAEDIFGASSLSPAIPATLRRLAELEPRTLALMHGSSYRGDGTKALLALADAYDSYVHPAA